MLIKPLLLLNQRFYHTSILLVLNMLVVPVVLLTLLAILFAEDESFKRLKKITDNITMYARYSGLPVLVCLFVPRYFTMRMDLMPTSLPTWKRLICAGE